MLITMTTSMSRSEERKEVGEWRPSRSGEGTRRHKYALLYAKLKGRNDDKREGRDDHKRDDKLFHVISTSRFHSLSIYSTKRISNKASG